LEFVKRHKTLVSFILLLLFLIGLAFIMTRPSSQAWMVKKVIQSLADGMETTIKTDSIHVNVFDDITLKNFYVEDHQQDTLLFVEELKVDVNVLRIFGQRISVEEIALNNAYINTYKTNDSLFNYQFVIDYFKKEEEDTISIEKKPLSWDIDLETAKLNNIQYYLEDSFKEELLYIRLGDGTIVFDDLNLKEQNILIKTADINYPQVQFRQAASKDSGEEKKVSSNDVAEETKSEKPVITIGDWTIKVDQLNVEEGLVAFQKGDPHFTNDGSIDFENLYMEPLHVQAQNIELYHDTIQMQLSELSLSEISGFEVDNLIGDLFLCDKKLTLTEFALKTPHSEIGDSLVCTYNSLLDWKDIVDKIRLNIDLRESYLGIRDLEYFVHSFARNDIANHVGSLEDIALEGKLKGKISNLRGSDIRLQAGKYTYFDGDIRLEGLPDIENTFINFKINHLKTRIEDLTSFFPEVKYPQNTYTLGNIDFTGYFTGYPSDFVAQGSLYTDIGSVMTDLNMKINGIARYSGELVLQDFDLKTFLGNDDFGKASFVSQIEGEGLKAEDLFVEVDGSIQNFDFRGYSYENVVVDGMIDRKLFQGNFSATDENFNLNFDGKLDFNDSIPKIGFQTQVFALDLKKLKLSKENIVLKGSADLDLAGNNIDNLIGKGRFDQLEIMRNDSAYRFDAFDFYANDTLGERSLSLESDFLNAYFKGNFSFKALPNQVKDYLRLYFPSRFKEVADISTVPADIDFGIEILKPLGFNRLIDPKLDYVSAGNIEGKFNNQERLLELFVDLEKIIYDGIKLDTIAVNIGSNPKNLMVGAVVSELSKDNILVNDIYLSGDVQQDIVAFNLQVENDSAYNNLDFEGWLYTQSDTLALEIEAMNVTVADKLWKTDKGSAAFLNKDFFSINDFQLTHKDQSISIEGGSLNEIFKNQVNADLHDIRVDELMQLLKQGHLEIEGIANGQVQIQDVFGTPVMTGDVAIDTFAMRGQTLGKVNIKAEKEQESKKILLLGDVKGEGYNISADGFIDLESPPNLDININAQQVSVAFLEGLIGSSISNTTGYGNGKIRVHGNPKRPELHGKLFMYGAGTTINYLNTHYGAVNSDLYFEGNRIRFEDIELYDKHNNSAYLNGILNLNDFKTLSTDVSIVTDKFLFMETTRADNAYFYGTAFGSGTAEFTGPFNNIVMNIYGTSKEGTTLSIPVTNETDVSEENFFTFINTDANASKDSKEAENQAISTSVLTINMNLDITPDAEIRMIFDLQAGDIIRSRGVGDMQIKIKTNEDLAMYGNYQVVSGDYLFTLQNVVNKKFILEKGGNIDFYGNPYDAQIDINAVYNVKNTSLSELAADTDLNLNNNANASVDTDVLLYLSGILSEPNIDFEIDIPDARGPGMFSSAARRIEEMNNDSDKNELNRQVFGLLIFNEFLPQQSLLDDNFIQAGITTTVSEFLSNQVTSLLSQTIQEIIPNSDLSFNWSHSEGDLVNPANLNSAETRDEIELVFTKRFFDNRVIIDISSNFDVGENSSNEWNTLISDVIVQYKMTDDGRYWVKLFSKTDREFISGTYDRAGISLFVSEEFDSFEDLVQNFKNRKTARKERKRKRNEGK